MTTNPFEFVKSKTLNLEFIVFLPKYKPQESINKDSSSNYMYMKLKKNDENGKNVYVRKYLDSIDVFRTALKSRVN